MIRSMDSVNAVGSTGVLATNGIRVCAFTKFSPVVRIKPAYNRSGFTKILSSQECWAY